MFSDGKKARIKAVKDNLPLELLNKHRKALGLKNPMIFEHENQLFEEHKTPIESAVVFLPKSKALIDMTLALVSGKVALGGTVVLAGANDAGIGSAKKIFEKNIGPVDQKIVGNHSALYVGKNKRLSANKKIEDFFSYFPLSYGDVSIEVANLPGIFSIDELDEGTKLLLDAISYDRTKILDVGCGAGVIGSIYKKKNPKSDVTMSDSSILAVMTSKKTLEKNNIESEVVLSDVFLGIEGQFDLILCNPPFHTGVETDYSFIERFAVGAKKHLKKNGEVWIVANSFLPYRDRLEKNIGPTDIVTDGKKFRIYRSVTKGL